VVRIPNTSHFSTARYQEPQDQARVETNDRKLQSVLHELTQILLDESFVLPIAEATVRDVGPEIARASVHGVTWNTYGLFAFEGVWLEQ
jgi:ABC-type transport system substrate-binding protein